MLICDFLHQRGKLNVSIISLSETKHTDLLENPNFSHEKSAQVLSNELSRLRPVIMGPAFHDLERAVTQKQGPRWGDLFHDFPHNHF